MRRVAVRLTSEQQRVVGTARARARRFGASPRETKALILALGVESNYRNLPYGDRDSEGALQQRPSQNWGPASESLETDVDQFLRAARKANTGGGSAGQLAQRVQRSAFPDRYDARSSEADALLRGMPRASGARAAVAPRSSTPAAEQSAGQQLTTMLIEPPEPQVPRPSMGLAAPEFAAGPKLAGGMALAGGSPAESPGQRLTRALGEVAQLPGMETPATPDGAAEPVRTGSSGAPAGGGGAGAAVNFARSRIGQYTESAGSNRGQQLDQLQARFGMKGQPWCAMFTSVAVTRGGAPKVGRTASVAVVRQQALQGGGGYERGLKKTARAGDLMLFANDHIGLVESVNRDGSVNTIEGNTGKGRVERRRRAAGSGDFARPLYGRRR